MPIEDKVVKYSVYVAHNDFVDLQRAINLRLQSGGGPPLSVRMIAGGGPVLARITGN